MYHKQINAGFHLEFCFKKGGTNAVRKWKNKDNLWQKDLDTQCPKNCAQKITLWAQCALFKFSY